MLIVIALIMIVLIAIIVYVCTNGPPQGVHGGTQNEEGKKQNDNEISGNTFIVYHTSVSILIV